MCCLHSAAWWRRHWERTGILAIHVADTLPDGWQLWRDWQVLIAPDNAVEIQAVEADRGSYLGYVRLVGRRWAEARLDEPIVSIPSEYAKKPLLRRSEQSVANETSRERTGVGRGDCSPPDVRSRA